MSDFKTAFPLRRHAINYFQIQTLAPQMTSPLNLYIDYSVRVHHVFIIFTTICFSQLIRPLSGSTTNSQQKLFQEEASPLQALNMIFWYLVYYSKQWNNNNYEKDKNCIQTIMSHRNPLLCSRCCVLFEAPCVVDRKKVYFNCVDADWTHHTKLMCMDATVCAEW